jgi:hypothetical protein
MRLSYYAFIFCQIVWISFYSYATEIHITIDDSSLLETNYLTYKNQLQRVPVTTPKKLRPKERALSIEFFAKDWNGYAQCEIRKPAHVQHIRRVYVPPPSQRQPISLNLVCEPHNYTKENLPKNYIYGNMTSHRFERRCPVVYDYLGREHHSPYLCTAAKQEQVCIFRLHNVVLGVCGGFIDNASRLAYSFYHESMGMKEPIYYHSTHVRWMSYYQDNLYINRIPANMKVYDLVIPARMIWDDNFGHLYHQSIPFIAHVYEFLSPSIWSKAYWHCSIFTAALLLLAGIPEERLLIQSPYQRKAKQSHILAKEIILPWVSGFCPPQTPSLHGVANRLLKLITKNLMKKYSLTTADGTSGKSPSIPQKRAVLYLSRDAGQTRSVMNEKVLIDAIRRYLNHDKYEFIVMNQTESYKNIEKLHQLWYEQAQHFSRARVIIGSHGKPTLNLFLLPIS